MTTHRLRTLVLTSLAAASLLAAGCGGSEEDAVEDSVKEFASAAKDKDFGGVCDKLTDELRQQIGQAGGGNCEEALKQFGEQVDLGGIPDPDEIEFESVEVDGDNATVKIKGEDNESKLVKEDGEWKADIAPGR
ncbi:hypothetical protein BH20ACT19_BH20ACT19_04800 [soil metagenome]